MSTYPVGLQLLHLHSGEVWEVIENELAGDSETWEGGIILCDGDYCIRCLSRPKKRDVRVHADYLHRSAAWGKLAGES